MISMDNLIQFAMQSDVKFRTSEEELEHLRNTKPILRDELLTCYQYLKEQGLLEDYKQYRG